MIKQILIGVLVGALLAGFGAFYAFHGRLSRVEGQTEDLRDIRATLMDLLQKTAQYPTFNIGGIPVPEPTMGRPVGGSVAVIDTINAEKPEEIQRDQVLAVFEPIANSRALIHLVLQGLVKINSITLRALEPNKAGIGDEARYSATISMENLTNRDVEILIPKGQVFENKEPKTGRQNIVAANTIRRILRARSSLDLVVEAYCINEGLAAPTDDPGNITNFKLRKDEFEGQHELWEYIAERLSEVQGD
jgi:hypothetical protein